VTESQVAIQLANGSHLHAPLVVGADGAQSWLRSQCAFAVEERSYEQEAIVCHVTLEKPHQNTAWQRFMRHGPLAFLPLADAQQASIVWSTNTETAEQMMAMSDEFFHAYLSEAICQTFGRITQSSARQRFPLIMRHAKEYVKPRVALIGDAAHTIHPLAGQGLNLGLGDAKALADTLQRAHACGRDVGGLSTLRRFERARREPNTTMLLGMRGLQRLFASPSPWVKLLRNQGLTLADSLPAIKRKIITHALG
jgi:2-octaprenylphenol hydroxylase